MNRDLLRKLGAIAVEVYVEAIEKHPGLFAITGVRQQTEEDQALLPVVACLDDLLAALDQVLNPPEPEGGRRAEVAAPPA